jgi:kynurenine aminotransferase
MGQGFFGYAPPQFVVDAAIGALGRAECNQYAPTRGLPRLRKALASVYSDWLGKSIDAESEVTVTTGANEGSCPFRSLACADNVGILSAFMAFIEPGDEVIVFEPFFDQWVAYHVGEFVLIVRYLSNIGMAGGKVVYVPLHPPEKGHLETRSSSEWTFDLQELENAITSRTKMIVINTPHNPIGKIFSKEELTSIGNLCARHNIIILSDEVYDTLHYAPFTRISTLSDDFARLTLTVGSAGKSFYVTGWRVGWMIGPSHLIHYVAAAHTRICYTTVTPLQEAIAVALEQAPYNGFWDQSRKELKAKQDRLNSIWEELGLPYANPDGGYFVLVNMKRVKIPDDYQFPDNIVNRPRDFKLCWFLIQEIGVAAIPPTEFCTDENAYLVEDYLRFAVCKKDEVLDAAKERLRDLKSYIA